MPTTKSLLEKRANVWSQMTSILDTAEEAGRDLTAEERSSYDNAETELDNLTNDIERLERHANRGGLDASVVTPGSSEVRSEQTPDEEYREAFAEWARSGMGEGSALTGEQRSLLRSGFVAPEERAQAVGTGSAGGYLVPEGFRMKIVEKMKDFGAVREVAEVITTTTGNPLPWPTNDDTGNVGALLAENTQVSEQDLTLGTAQLDAYKYTSKLVRVSIEFLQDTDWMQPEAFLARKLGERLGRITNLHYTSGTGSSQPNGIVTGAVSGVTAASTTVVTFDELIDLEHSVDPAYRRSPNTQFMFGDVSLKGLRKVKDSDGQYLWQPNVQAGAAPTFNGYRYVINQDFTTPAAGVKSILFGDFRAGYVIREVRGIEMIRMSERYADYFQVGFVSFLRTDAEVQDSAAYKALTQAAS